MTNPGPWTPTGQPETKKSRTWWIIGGSVSVVVLVAVAFLAGLGWEDATSEAAPTDTAEIAETEGPVPASTAPLNVTETIPKLLRCSREMVCAGINNSRLDDIESSIAAVLPREASEDLSEAIGDWRGAYSVYYTQWCHQEEFEICDDAASAMDDAVWEMQQIIG